jgi:hypothetical protein
MATKAITMTIGISQPRQKKPPTIRNIQEIASEAIVLRTLFLMIMSFYFLEI